MRWGVIAAPSPAITAARPVGMEGSICSELGRGAPERHELLGMEPGIDVSASHPAARCIARPSTVSYNPDVEDTLTIRLDAETAQALEDAARRTNRSRGQIVREALAEHLRRPHDSALAGLAKYAGLMRGAADLSTNKRHLKGLGKRRRR